MNNNMTTHSHIRFNFKKALFFSISLILLFLMGCAMQQESSAGKVNGVYIKKQDLMSSLRGHFTGFVLENDRTPDETEKKELYKKTWRDITIHVILKDYFKKYKISVTNQEVIDSLLNNVPATIKKASVFQTNGSFDRALYVQTLLADKSKSLDWLKQYYYDYYVPLSKLKLELQNKEVISKSELNKLNKIINSSADIDWIVFEPGKTDVIVSQSDIENYYQKHLKDFQVKPFASFGWAALPINISDEDSYNAKTKADSIYNELNNGGTFVDFVERFSQAGSAKYGGSMGFIKNEELPPAVKTAINGIEINKFTRPVKHKSSWVIYQMVERTKNLVKLNELVIKIAPGTNTKELARLDAIELRDLALQLGLSTAANEMSLDYHLSGIVAKDSLWLQDGDLSAYLTDRAYTQKAGAVLEPVYSEALQAWVVATVIDVQPNQYKQLLDVSDEINSALLISKQRAKAMENAVNWAQLNQSDLQKAAANQAMQVIKTPALMITGTVMSQPIRSGFVKIITDYQQNKAQSAYQIDDKVLLPVVSKVNTINPPILTQKDVRKYYFEYLNPGWFDVWLEAEIKKASVVVWGTYP